MQGYVLSANTCSGQLAAVISPSAPRSLPTSRSSPGGWRVFDLPFNSDVHAEAGSRMFDPALRGSRFRLEGSDFQREMLTNVAGPSPFEGRNKVRRSRRSATKRKRPGGHPGLLKLVETRRIELPTFALRTRRSPS